MAHSADLFRIGLLGQDSPGVVERMLFTHIHWKDWSKKDFLRICQCERMHALRTLLPGFLLSVKAVFKLSKFFFFPFSDDLLSLFLFTFLSPYVCKYIYVCVCVCVHVSTLVRCSLHARTCSGGMLQCCGCHFVFVVTTQNTRSWGCGNQLAWD